MSLLPIPTVAGGGIEPPGHEFSVYTDRERAALAWTEAVTHVGPNGIPDEVYRAARRQFDERQLVDLTMAIIAVNGWNHLAIAFQSPEAGSHMPTARKR